MIHTDKERQAPTKIEDAEPSHLARYTFAIQFIKNTDNVLDIPCGGGYGVGHLAIKSKKVVGVDIFDEAIQHSKEFFQKENTEFIVADMENLEKSFNYENKFDLVTSFEGIEHIAKQESFLENVSNILKDDGLFIISTPRKPHGSPYHKIEHSLESFKELLSKQFVIEKMYGQIYTDIFDLSTRKENPDDYHRFNFIAVCKCKPK